MPPQVFIPLAEESGLIHALGEWVLRTAAAQCRGLARRGAAAHRVDQPVGAAVLPRRPRARTLEIVRAAGCDPSWIELEVTETSLLHDLDAIRKVLHELRDDGFAVAIDDFGTGYSSLTHLKHFPIDTLKIDISFIADLETDPRRRGDHRGDHRPRARPRPQRGRRGRRDAGAARLPRAARLRRVPGLSRQPAAAGRAHSQPSARPERLARTVRRRSAAASDPAERGRQTPRRSPRQPAAPASACARARAPAWARRRGGERSRACRRRADTVAAAPRTKIGGPRAPAATSAAAATGRAAPAATPRGGGARPRAAGPGRLGGEVERAQARRAPAATGARDRSWRGATGIRTLGREPRGDRQQAGRRHRREQDGGAHRARRDQPLDDRRAHRMADEHGRARQLRGDALDVGGIVVEPRDQERSRPPLSPCPRRLSA